MRSVGTLPLGDEPDVAVAPLTSVSTDAQLRSTTGLVRPIPLPVLERMLGIVGMTGSGKTYTAKGGVEQLLAAGRRVVIIDPLGVWWGLRLLPDGKTPSGFTIAIFGGDHSDFPIEPEQGRGVARIVDEARTSAIIDVSGFSKEEQTEFLEGFLDELYELNKVHRSVVYLIIDEADEFAPQNATKDEKPLFRVIDRTVRRGRILGFRVMMITQRPAALHKNVLTQCQSLIAMALNAEQDRKAIEGWVKGQPDAAASREVVRTLGQLQTGEGWLYAPRLHIIDRGRFPTLSTFDSSSTPEHGDDLVDVAVAKLDMGALADAMAKLGKGGEVEDDRDQRIAALADDNADLRRQLDGYERAVEFYGRRFKEIALITLRALEPPGPEGYATAEQETAGRRRMVVEVIDTDALANAFADAGSVVFDSPPCVGFSKPIEPASEAIDAQLRAAIGEQAGPAKQAARDERQEAVEQLVGAIAAVHPHPVTLIQAGKLARLETEGPDWHRAREWLLGDTRVQMSGRQGRFTLSPQGVVDFSLQLLAPRLHPRDLFAELVSPDAAALLRALTRASKPLTRAELAERSGVVTPKSSRLYSLIAELEALDLVERVGRSHLAAAETVRG